MAVNKNFVVKNGIEVNTNLIVADTDSNKVGIGTTVPEYTLHVFEGTGIGASMVYVTGISTSLEEFNVGVGGTTFTAISNAGAGIAGSVGVGTDLPGYLLEVHAPVSTGQTALFVRGDMHVTGDINLDDITLNELRVTGISTFEDSIFVGSGATVGLNTVHFTDHAQAMFGDGNDLKIFHNESSSFVSQEGTGNLVIRNTTDDSDVIIQSDNNSGGIADYFLADGSTGEVKLFHYGSARFNTNAIGVEATGTLQSTGITTLASSGGITTTGGDLFIGGNLFVSDNITLDTNLNILGIATIATLRVSDTATGENGTESLIVGTGLSVRGSSTGVAVTLAGAGGITTTGGDLFVGGDLHISEDVILDTNLEIIGIATIGTLQVSSTSGINTISSTVQSSSKDTGALVIEGGVGIEKNLFVGGGAEVTGITTITGTLDANGALDVDGHTELDDVNVSGASTFTGAIDANGALDVDGHTELDDVNVSGASTFTGAADFNGAVDIDGHTELDDVNVSGTATITTFNVGTAGQSGLVGITTILDEDNMASDSATALVTQQSIKAYVDNQITAEDLDFGGDSGTGSVDLDSQTFTIAGTANEIETSASSQTLTIGLPNFVTVSNGLNVTGNGSTTTTLTVSGVSTFTGNIDANGNVDIDGHTELDDVNVSGASTFTGAADFNGAVDIDGHTELDDVNVSGASTFTGAADFNGAVDIDGHTELDDVNVAGFSTFVSNVIIGTGATVGFGSTAFFRDNAKAIFGDGEDLKIFHDGSVNRVRFDVNTVFEKNDSTDIATFLPDGAVTLFHSGTARLETTSSGVVATGIVTASGGFDLGIHSGGSSVASGPIKILNFIGTGNTFAYDAGTDTIDISIAGGSGSGGGGITTTHQEVQSTSATGISTFSTTAFRSAHMIVGITQGTSYQTGRYLIIHDDTTPTILEESALATGDMIATFDATISGGNLTVRVNMSSAGLATVAVKMDTINSDSSS